ncbi:hypothetical protein F2Q68_00008032 [Brassica cretica]|uniref:Protein kinase domain-containing protein n=1 Tax=Brassica cretica TaxID=69181 RepID=A0A8S9KRA5_BRACR|nr:hypothetical protein F2Q68_00008032 [Brassica cretica]
MSRNPRFCFFLFLFLNSSVFFSIPCFSIDEQGQALLSWKSQLNISGNALSSWNAAASNPCKWVGIKCNARGQVSEIQLQVMDFQGPLPSTDLRRLKSLTSLSLTSVNLTGSIPKELGDLPELEVLDLADNSLSGEIPVEIFNLRKLKTLSLDTNNLEGVIPSELGNLTNLVELTLFDNKLGGEIPKSIGELRNLEIFRAGGNKNLRGELPWEIGNCEGLVTLGLAETSLSGKLPASIGGFTGSIPGTLPKSLQFIDFSGNSLTGRLPPKIGSLTELTKLNLAKNRLSGEIAREISSCRSLQLLNLGDNSFTGEIPEELGRISTLAISLNLSCNSFTGEIPSRFSSLVNLGTLDISHNKLAGNLNVLADLQNLVSLNISFNDFSGELPNTLLFKKLPLSVLESNKGLFISARPNNEIQTRHRSAVRLTMSILVAASVVLVLMAVYTLVKAQRVAGKTEELDTCEVTLYQKLDFSIDDIVKNLTSANVIGTGSSGVVYRVTIPSGETLAVKKMWSKEETGAFNSEINALGSIRHRNIIRLLGWCSNKNVKLLFYDYLPNGSLSSLLHGAGKGRGGRADWEARYDVLLGVAHALAYLHHDCLPPILHGDVKAMNVLLGSRFEPHLADFGLAKTVNTDGDSSKSSNRPPLAGSYAYMAPGWVIELIGPINNF